MSVTTLLGKDPGLTPLTVLHSPGGESNCHALSVTQRATGGQAGAVSLVSYNSTSAALQIKSTGPYLQAYDGTNALKVEITNAGNITTSGTITSTGATTLASLTVTGAVSVGGALGVTGATTLSTVSTSGAASLNSAAVTNNATVGGTLGVTGTSNLGGALNVTGYTTLSGGQANSDWAIFGNLSMFGSGKGYRLRTSGSALDFDATGVDLIVSNFSGASFNGTQRSYFRLSADAQNVQVAGKVEFAETLYGTVRHVLDGAANSIGFFGTAATTKQTVSGSRGGNAALASLITALAAYGLVTDGSSA